MKARKTPESDLDYLRRCKASTPEQRLDWLQSAVEFAREAKRARAERLGAGSAPV